MEIHQAGNRTGEQNDRSPLPSNIIIPRSWTRTELERRSLFFFFHFFQRKRESSFWIQRTKRKKKKERKNWNSYNDITRCTDVDPRELIHAPGASRPIVHGWTRRFHKTGTGGARWSDGLKRDAKIWRVNESPNAPRIIAPLLIQIRERASSSSSSPPRRRAYCNTSFENSHHWVPHPWGACSRVTLVT